jgi:DNA-binding MarR family transcriptional regulator
MSAKMARECWAMIYRLIFEGEARDRMGVVCSAAGVPPGVLKTLIHLAPDEPTPMRELASHFGFDGSYITALVDDLERAGLAERRAHPTDRRVKTVALTPKGAAVQQRAYELMWAPPECFDALTTAEQRQLRDLLGKAVAADALLAAEGGDHHGRLGTASQRSPGRPAGADGQPSGRGVPIVPAKRSSPNGVKSVAGTRPRMPSATRAPQ